MKIIKIYGNNTWPACVNLKEDLSKNGIAFEYIDILESMYNLKQYLYFRDNSELFNSYKETQRLGIPTVLVESNGDSKLYLEPSMNDFI